MFPASNVSAKTDIFLKLSLAAALFLFPFSLVYGPLKPLPPSWSFVRGLVIALHALIVLLWLAGEQSWKPALSNFAAVGGCAFALEWIGSVTGFPFGVYRYTEVLGWRLAGVPVVIPMAWFSVSLASLSAAVWLLAPQASNFLRGFLAALFVVALDLVLEPAALAHRYWIWEAQSAPLANYLSWFLIAWFLTSRVIRRNSGARREIPWVPVLVYAMQWILFAWTAGTRGFMPAIGLSAGFLLAGVTLATLSRR